MTGGWGVAAAVVGSVLAPAVAWEVGSVVTAGRAVWAAVGVGSAWAAPAGAWVAQPARGRMASSPHNRAKAHAIGRAPRALSLWGIRENCRSNHRIFLCAGSE